ncbi:hypothetical protein F8388_002341 [Cannabis sativa]|uniref:Uncharacterized protein n=1 Tax=Cannabis sativa TaxID=3483 RepID=A0A7J6EFQ5_CANSA|nr:hypothetical protein F8388_002341 [Cannabis sativa]KAF4391930.1 hypothetical protein G4B88_007505 [Cannabis sativa]
MSMIKRHRLAIWIRATTPPQPKCCRTRRRPINLIAIQNPNHSWETDSETLIGGPILAFPTWSETFGVKTTPFSVVVAVAPVESSSFLLAKIPQRIANRTRNMFKESQLFFIVNG